MISTVRNHFLAEQFDVNCKPICRPKFALPQPSAIPYFKTPASRPRLTHLRSLLCLLPLAVLTTSAQSPTVEVFGYRDFTHQAKLDAEFLAVPDAKLAGQHLKTLTSAPHWASSPEDYATAATSPTNSKPPASKPTSSPTSVLLNKPVKILIEAFDATGDKSHVRPHTRARRPHEKRRRPLPGRSRASSPPSTAPPPPATSPPRSSTPTTARLADFQQLAELGISVKDKIVLVRYGENFRGVKVYIAQQYGARGVLIYSDPADDGYFRGDIYPKGPCRPDSAVQRGSVQFLPIYPGDPTTPGIASTPDLPASKRIPADKLQANQPSIPANPLSYNDAAPILQALGGASRPRDWQGALPFTYHLGASERTARVTVHMHLEQDIALRTIWDVIGTVPGTAPPKRTTGSSPATTVTPGSTAQSIPTPAPPPCSKPSMASANSSSRAGSPNAPSSLAVGTPKKKA